MNLSSGIAAGFSGGCCDCDASLPGRVSCGGGARPPWEEDMLES